jgi:hypothetical protein
MTALADQPPADAGRPILSVGSFTRWRTGALGCFTIGAACDVFVYCPSATGYSRERLPLPGCVPGQARSNVVRLL